MPAQSLSTDAFVLLRRPPADSFQTFTLFSAAHGPLTALQRVPKKSNAAHTVLDLFDEAALQLESSNQGRTWFIGEVQLLARPTGIARSYEALRLASALSAFVARNRVAEESRGAVARLLRNAFAAFGTATLPEVVFFKSLFLFARDEGYPVKQEWIPTLPRELRVTAEQLLHSPLAELEKSAATDCPLLLRRLEEYLRRTTELLFD